MKANRDVHRADRGGSFNLAWSLKNKHAGMKRKEAGG